MKQKEEKSLENKQKILRFTEGNVIEIKIDDYYVYAQMLKEPNLVFFDFRTKEQLKDLSVLNDKPAIFILSVFYRRASGCTWEKVGKMPIRDEFKTLPLRYIYRPKDKPGFQWAIYDTNAGKIIETTEEEVRKHGIIESATVWYAINVEDRIRCYYSGEISIWEKSEILYLEEKARRQGQKERSNS